MLLIGTFMNLKQCACFLYQTLHVVFFFNAISNLYRSLKLMQTQVLLFALNKMLAINFGQAIFQGLCYPIKVELS